MPLAFGDCVLDPETRELRRGGALVHLPPQVYRLLEILIEQRPRVVTRNELDELLWPRSYVARSSLGRVVAELRDALGDDADEPQIIRTVHAVGYAFSAEVAHMGAASSTAARLLLVWDRKIIQLGAGEHLLGRGLDCDVRIEASGVSRHHARFAATGAATTIVDLGSKNGTWVNGKRISEPTPLRDGDEVVLGTAVLTVRDGGHEGTTQTVFGR
jgi:DNA-binding winged helix-turn-helix (wHTH) protein